MDYVDIIIVGSGMSGLYSAYKIQQLCPSSSFLILEKYKKDWIGGRTSNDTFYGTEIVTGAGIGRKDTNPLLIQLMRKLNIHYSEFHSIMNYSNTFTPVDIVRIVDRLKKEYKKHPELHDKTFKEFSIKILGNDLYTQFVMSAGYTDYEHADIQETLYNYGMDDNKGGWTSLHVPWKKMVETLYRKIGKDHFKFSSDVTEIKKVQHSPCLFEINTTNNHVYHCNRVIVATTISGIKKLVPGASDKSSLYQEIHGQPFLRLYAKFDKESTETMKQYVTHYTIVPGPLQKIIPIDSDKGVYMIAYSDNDSALLLKDHLKNTSVNRTLFCRLLERSLGMPEKSLKIIALKDYYWPIGTHYYAPLSKSFRTRNSFLHRAQHPEKGMLVVGEAVSRYQGWVEGALESVEAVVIKQWVQKECE
jgi:hypothetical protein